jgi:hypothetical protein
MISHGPFPMLERLPSTYYVTEKFQNVARLRMFSDSKVQDEKGRLTWIRKFNARKIDFDWEEFNKDYGYVGLLV